MLIQARYAAWMSYETLDPAGARERLNGEPPYTFLDVRTPEEFEAGHPPGAYNIPYLFRGPGGAQPNASFLAQVQKHFDTSTSLVLGCAVGVRSAHACELLAGAGFGSLVNMDGGYSGRHDPSTNSLIEGWESRGFPTSTTPEAGRTHAELK
ncbi:MAG: rhodanese-related sulfurtransferase [Planctomycetota bacterium]|jgi:rhodanese-related sulfurtransferase